MAGFFAPADVARFAQVRADTQGKPTFTRHEHLTLVDIRGMRIQTQEVVDAFRAVLADPTYRSRRIAFIVTRSLARLQIQRAALGRQAGYFTDPDAAMEWLLSEEEPPALAPPDAGFGAAETAAVAHPG